MVAKRIIPCLDVKDGRTVKGIHFVGLRDMGDAVELGARYAAEGADELVYLDISASAEGRKTFCDLVSRVAEQINIPFTVGGGIATIDDAARLLDAGADKISVNTAAIKNPGLIDAIAGKYGSQFVVIAIDARVVDGRWMATTHGGRVATDRELFSWAREAQERGAGELLFTSMDHDGTRDGYPCGTYAALAESLSIPIIASGGAGCIR
ncbi:MAG: imidazole glycerol phosphate synthase subunit HisF, partial [Bacteroidales bacterium]|nr:imidazole glycerol phosphate synthase subunit HisF [Bacteroidales bacterium]